MEWRCLAIMDSETFDENQNLIPTVKDGCRPVSIWMMIWPSGPEHLTVTEWIMDSSVYRNMIEAICLTATAWLKMDHTTGQWSQAYKMSTYPHLSHFYQSSCLRTMLSHNNKSQKTNESIKRPKMNKVRLCLLRRILAVDQWRKSPHPTNFHTDCQKK